MSTEPSPDFDGEYGAVRLPEAWHVLSLLCFAGALGSRYLVSLLTGGARPQLFLPGMVTLALAGLGLVLGLLGLRVPAGRSTARVAVFLNATVLVLGLLAVWAYFYISPG